MASCQSSSSRNFLKRCIRRKSLASLLNHHARHTGVLLGNLLPDSARDFNAHLQRHGAQTGASDNAGVGGCTRYAKHGTTAEHFFAIFTTAEDKAEISICCSCGDTHNVSLARKMLLQASRGLFDKSLEVALDTTLFSFGEMFDAGLGGGRDIKPVPVRAHHGFESHAHVP
ncbi:hypothetical protein HG530_003862 [Fusarium avenaceum]|nr:hypothetical protein HG530_003862 [Fusarium avenaceum]